MRELETARRLPSLESRLQQLGLALAVAFAVLAARLWYLQVMRGEHYAVLAESNRIRQVPLTAPRGLIYDREGRLVAGNRRSFTVSLVPDRPPEQREAVLQRLAELLGVPRAALEAAWEEGYQPGSHAPVRLWREASPSQVTAVEEHRARLPGVVVQEEPVRNYPRHELGAHVVGYVAPITSQELQELAPLGYRGTDFIGRMGLEREYEAALRGQDGYQAVEVDARERPRRVLETAAPRPGADLYLTLDLALQQQVERALVEGIRQAQLRRDRLYPGVRNVPVRAAAAVVVDTRSGAVRALASWPAYDPGQLVPWNADLAGYWSSLSQDPGRPLLNRVTDGLYAPGSTFKVVTAVAALESGVFRPDETWFVDGVGPYGKLDWWRSSRTAVPNPEGRHLNLLEAFEWSSNDVFWELGRRVGIDGLAEWARRFGLGQSVGIDLYPRDMAGLVPDPAWKRRRFTRPDQQRWYESETLDVAIGQGALQVTVLQLAALFMAVANDGVIFRPYLVEAVRGPDGTDIYRHRPEVLRVVRASARTWEMVRQGLARVVSGPNGTARQAFAGFPIPVGGKTGTAQLAGLEGAAHALFAALAPIDRPEVAVVVVVEHGGSGALAAAPIARAILEAYFGLSAR